MRQILSLIPKSWKAFVRERAPWVLKLAVLMVKIVYWLRILGLLVTRFILQAISSVFSAIGIEPPFQKFLRMGTHYSDDTQIVYQTGSPLQSKIAWIVSFTGVSNEPRVLRQSQALMEAGWSVVVVGYQGHTPTNPDWHFVKMSTGHPYSVDKNYYLEFLRRACKVLCRLPFGRRWRVFMARKHHAHIPLWSYHTQSVCDFARQHPELKADLVLAHDFHSCEVAFGVRDQYGAKISVDCHEYSRGQYAHDPHWVKYTLPYVSGMHDYYLPLADSVTTVSAGIADLMNKEEQLKQPVQLIRSMPIYRPFEVQEPGDLLTVLYHGDISHVRGLHMAIASMPLWREEFHLLLRGSGDAAYIEELRAQAAGLGLSERVHIEGPVPFDQIIPRANKADIGYFVHYDASPQKRFVLPNKFFEYVGAGLALCVSDLPEMARLTRKYDMGHLVVDYDEQKIADSINAFDRASITAFKRNALEAAKELNWDEEKKKLLEHYANLL